MKNKSVIFLCLTLLFAFLVTSCQTTDDNETTADETTAVQETESTGEPEESFEDGPLVPYQETVVAEIAYSQGNNMQYAEGETIDNNFVTKMYKDYLNIEYKPKWIVDSSKESEKLNTAIASNDLPDFIMGDAQIIGRLIEAGQIQTLNSFYEEYATPAFKEIAEYQDKRGFLMGQVGEDYYALPISNDFANNVAMFYIRADWMDALGLEDPETLEDLINIAKAFKENNPGNVEENLLVPIAFDKAFGQNYASIKIFANPLGAYYQQWVLQDDGSLAYGSILPEMRNTLQVVQQAYSEGLLDLEFAVKDSAKVAEDVAAGYVGIFPGVFWSPLWPLGGTLDNVEGADWNAYPICMNSEGIREAQNTLFAYDGVAVREGYEHPEALVKSMNLWVEIFHGSLSGEAHEIISQEKYIPVSDNWHSQALPVFFSHPEKNLRLSANFIDIWNAQDPSLAETPEAENRWEIIKAGGSTGWGHLAFLTESEPVLREYDNYVYEEFVGAPTETMLLKQANLEKLEYEVFIKIIMGDSIDKFDQFILDWLQQGGQDITDEVNEWYKSIS